MKTNSQNHPTSRTVLLHSRDVRWITFCQQWKRLLQHWLDQQLAAICTPAPLQVWSIYDELEQCWWSAFDPATGQRIEQVPEANIKTWIENRR